MRRLMALAFPHGPYSDRRIAAVLAGITIILYLIIFSILYLVASSNGTSLEKMIGLELPHYADTTEYRNLANSMLNEGRFALSSFYPTEFARVPGVPTFFVVVTTIFGTLTVVPLIQVLFSAATVAMIYLIGARHFSRSVSIAAAAIYMMDPIVIYAAWTPISESLFMLLFVGGIFTLGLQARRWLIPLAVGGILLGLSVYVRPIGNYIIPFAAAFGFAYAPTKRLGLRNAAIVAAAAFLTLSPWMMRNYVLAGHFEFSSNRAWQMYAYNMSLFEQVRTGESYEQIQLRYSQHFATTSEKILRQYEYADKLDAITKEKLLAHPFQYAAFHAWKSFQLFIGSSIVNVKYHMYQFGILEGDRPRGEGAWGMLVQHRLHDAFIQVFTNFPRLIERLLWLSAYIGIWYATYTALRRRTTNAVWVVVAFLLIHAYAVMIGPGSDDTRYRMPVEPFLLLLASFSAADLWQRIRSLYAQRRKHIL